MSVALPIQLIRLIDEVERAEIKLSEFKLLEKDSPAYMAQADTLEALRTDASVLLSLIEQVAELMAAEVTSLGGHDPDEPIHEVLLQTAGAEAGEGSSDLRGLTPADRLGLLKEEARRRAAAARGL